ncbi:MAG: hypothetical protein NVS3B21_19070 [Acidimicrobiales bacterium]
MVRAAAGRTLGAGVVHVEVSVAADLAGNGTVDLGAGRGSFSFQRVGAQAFTNDRFDVVVDGAREWVRAGGPAGGLPGTTASRPWIDGAPGPVATAAGPRVGALASLLVRPGLGTGLAFLRGATKVFPYGGEEVRGVNTYRYSLVVDLALAAASSPDQRAALDAAAAAIGPVQWPADVWLDAEGRVRRLQMAEDPRARTTTTKANLLFAKEGNFLALTNLTFFDFGSAPPGPPPGPDASVDAT